MKRIVIILYLLLSMMPILAKANGIVPSVVAPEATDNGKCDTSDGKVCLDSPLGAAGSNPQLLIGTVINGIMGIVGSLALLMFVYGGLVWMTAAGASDKVQKGKDILMWATIGLVVIFSSYGLVKFVLDVIGGA